MRVLIVEHDSGLAQAIAGVLTAEGFGVEVTDLGEEAVDLAKRYEFDAITLDLSLAGGDGEEVLRALRMGQIHTPVIVVDPSMAEIACRIDVLRLGADDTLSNPFHRDELVERLRAVIRRSQGHASPVITAGEVVLDVTAQSVAVCGRLLHLTKREYQMLEVMMQRRGQALSKSAFLDHLYGGLDEPEAKIIDVYMCKLRKKLSDAGAPGHIETIWGRGYTFRTEPHDEAPRAPGAGRGVGGVCAAEIALALQAGPSEFPGIRRGLPGRTENALRYALSVMVGIGHLTNVGHRRAAVYQLTPAGRAFHLPEARDAA